MQIQFRKRILKCLRTHTYVDSKINIRHAYIQNQFFLKVSEFNCKIDKPITPHKEIDVLLFRLANLID